jgi:hypothetical protein
MHRTHAEIADTGVGDGLVGLLGSVGRPPQQGPLRKVLPSGRRLPVGLAEVQDVGPEPARQLGGVVDADQDPVPTGHLPGHLQGSELGVGVHLLLADLHDVDTSRARRLEEVGQVTLALARVRAQVEARQPELCVESQQSSHRARLARRPRLSPRCGRSDPITTLLRWSGE